jgi:hypothetical protein
MNIDEVNITTTACIRSVDHWGYTAYHNLCTGVVTDIPWSPMTPIYAVSFVLLMALVALVSFQVLTK